MTSVKELENTIPGLLFFGDLDSDGLPDFILNEGYHYEFHKMILYLSTFAQPDEFVHPVAEDSEWRDC